MKSVEFPNARGVVGLDWLDITPPVGIYHRMWGAATHDRASGVHRPLRVTALYVDTGDSEQTRLLISVDHCLLEADECRRIADAVSAATTVPAERVFVTCSHTHAAGLMSRSRSEEPGGGLIAPYLDEVALHSARAARSAQTRSEWGTLVFGAGRCSLAKHRDYFDADHRSQVCGFNPGAFADDTVLIARIISDSGRPMGTIVNYACHPTTLAWDNTLISPDYVGAMRDTVETSTGAPCLFLQGASGDLGPMVGFVGDPAVADSNGRQLAYAVLAALEGFPPPASRYAYSGPVVSGTAIGTWKFEPLEPARTAAHARSRSSQFRVDLAYRADLATIDGIETQKFHWLAREAEARSSGNVQASRDARARVEQCTRQIHRLRQLPAGRVFPFPVQLWQWGDSLWVLVGGEHYQSLQVELRRRFPRFSIVVATLCNDWQPGYIPPASTFGYGIYQETIALTAAGSAEILIESIAREISELMEHAEPTE